MVYLWIMKLQKRWLIYTITPESEITVSTVSVKAMLWIGINKTM